MKLSSFTVILTFVILMIIGVAIAPLIDVGTDPVKRQGKSITISYGWPNVAAKTVEQNLTSPIEGMVSALKGVESVSSKSYFGRSEIVVRLKKDVNVSSVRFEIASVLRQSYGRLPKGVSFPVISGGEIVNDANGGGNHKLLLTYQVNANLKQNKIKDFVESNVTRQLQSIDGVANVEVTGTKDSYMDISYDPQLLVANGVTAQDMVDAIANYIGKDEVIGTVMHETATSRSERITVHLATEMFGKSLGEIPIKNVSGKIVYLNDLATIMEKEREPEEYYRVNGLNTIYINIYISADGKAVAMSDIVQERMSEIIPEMRRHNVYFRMSYDSAENQRNEMSKLIGRTLMSLVILLVFVWLSYRDVKYLAIVASALVANLLIAIIAYWMFDLKLHVFSLAGITVSLGLVMDSTIVMADHYGYYRNRKAFLAILSAMLTTIGSLVVIFFLPDDLQEELYDFAWIVIINLVVSLSVSLLLVPALIDRFHYSSRHKVMRHGRAIVRWNRFYKSYSVFVSQHRWICYALLIIAFGLPFSALPDKIGESDNLMRDGRDEQVMPWYGKVYNATLGSDFFLSKCKGPLDKWLGGSVGLFIDYIKEDAGRHNESQEKVLHVMARMPVGSTAVQLNQKLLIVEQLLKTHKEVSEFVTRINGRNGEITVKFHADAVKTAFPYMLENEIISKVITIGGADWSTYGVSERGFSNALNLKLRTNRITVSGYNYDQLYRIAEDIVNSMALNKRVQDLTIVTPGFENQEDELFMQYKREDMSRLDVSPYSVHSVLDDLLTQREVGYFRNYAMASDVMLHPTSASTFDKWHMENEQIFADSVGIFVPNVMNVSQREAKNVIPKENQEYVLDIAFNILGSYTYTSEYLDNTIRQVNRSLPVGYTCKKTQWSSSFADGANYWLLLLIVVIVFFICAIQFESLRLAWVIVSVIPLSLIGSFLTFCITGIEFGSGGFASLVMLIGIVVNSGIYIISQYCAYERQLGLRTGVTINSKDHMRSYLKAYNHKIIPIVLTVASTIMGLVPFFLDSNEDPFWFSFATGVTGGLLFSVPALIFFMPIFIQKGKCAHW